MTSGSTTAVPTDLAIADVQWLGRLARRLAADADDADDLTQETLVAAWSQPAREGAQRPWLVAVLRNRLRMLGRTRVRREAREDATDVQFWVGEDVLDGTGEEVGWLDSIPGARSAPRLTIAHDPPPG
ncbi:MAG: hypothetical protein IAG13_13705 [Deltaproteobacteria bacterium]|nr:hypothetical protein [Nannocystaceae bacterium]